MDIPKDMSPEKFREIERVSSQAAALQLSDLVAVGNHTFPEACERALAYYDKSMAAWLEVWERLAPDRHQKV